jgi:transposase-like protein
MDDPKTLLQAIEYFSDAENCRKFMIAVRWADDVVRCPHCGNDKVSYLEKAKVYFCPNKHPKQKFSLKVGTIFEDSAIGLEKWLPAAWLIANCKNGISSYELARAVGVTQKSGWHMLHRLRAAMKQDVSFQLGGPDRGPVEADEAFVGGKVKNMHHSKRPKSEYRTHAHGNTRDGERDKAIVMGLFERNSRTVRAKVIPNVRREVLQDEILKNVSPRSAVFTDTALGYKGLAEVEFIHATVNHMTEYVRGQVHTNCLENFWGLLKRSLRGTYVAVEPFHLDAYVDEQVFRFNNRKTKDNPLTDTDRFVLLMSQVTGKRLTYAELTGKEEGVAGKPF